MKRTILIGAMVLGFILVANIAFGNFYVIPTRPRIAGTEIKSLPYTISSSGFYFITRDLISPGDGITVNADNVTIDLMGFSLIGPGSGTGTGIYMSDRANVEVRNGTVRAFGHHGIHENHYNGKNHRIIGVRANGNGIAGIQLNGLSHLVKDCTASDNNDCGIYVYKGCTVTGNTAYSNQFTGICGFVGCTVTGNTAYSNQARGVYAGNGSTVIGNTAYSNQGYGIYAMSGCTVIGNTARYNKDYGIYLFSDCFVHENTATMNTNDNITPCGSCTFGTNHAP